MAFQNLRLMVLKQTNYILFIQNLVLTNVPIFTTIRNNSVLLYIILLFVQIYFFPELLETKTVRNLSRSGIRHRKLILIFMFLVNISNFRKLRV